MTEYLDYTAVAARTGVQAATLRRYASRGLMPPPDVRIGQSPGWLPETIDAWLASRPGKGGRPRAAADDGR